MNKLKKISAALCGFMLMTCSCTKIDAGSESVSSKVPKVTEPTTSPVTEAVSSPKNKGKIKGGYISISGEMVALDDNCIGMLGDAQKNLEELGTVDGLTVIDECDWVIMLSQGSGHLNYQRVMTPEGWRIIDTDMRLYNDSAELADIIAQCFPAASKDAITAEKEYFSVECSEPKTEEEYVDAAVKCVDGWLTSLQGDDVDDYWRNSKFKITIYDNDDPYFKVTNYLACGMVDGVKNFVVEVCFNAKDSGKNTFYDAYYQEGRYTDAGTFWSGCYICGRFTYADGKCTLVEFDTRDGSNRMKSGLSGIADGDYKTFFDFARRSDYRKAVEESFVPYGSCTVSANLTQTQDGKPINVDIYTTSPTELVDGRYTAIWDERAYVDGDPTYRTGLYFTDNGTGHMPDTLPESFDLTFDNYDGDGNPDFCCRYDSDGDGTYYVLESVQTDGRIFNLSGRAFSGGIYIAGCTDPSPRLQRTAEIPYIGWKKDEGGRFYPTDNNGNEIEIEDIRMYSDRLYLPEGIRKYSADENEVTCFFWNNTDKELTTDGTYAIEVMSGGEWETVADGLKINGAKVKPREHAEITYDISAVKERHDTVYRIVQKSGNIAAYGNFYLEGKKVTNISLKAEPVYSGSLKGTFSAEFFGSESAGVRSVQVVDGDKNIPCSVFTNEDKYCFITQEMPTKAGKYKLIVNGDAECELEIIEHPKNNYDVTIDADILGDRIEVKLTSSADCEIDDYTVMEYKHDEWYDHSLDADIDDFPIVVSKNKPCDLTIKNGETEYMDEEMLRSYYDMMMDDAKDNGGKLPKNDKEIFKELGLSEDASQDEFVDAARRDAEFSAEYRYVIKLALIADDARFVKYFFI